MDTTDKPCWFRPLGKERHIFQEIVLAKINPIIDIVALVLSNYDVLLQRIYTGQRVCIIPKPTKAETEEPIKLSDLEWSPDGRFLVLAYNQRVFLKDGIESSIPGREKKHKAYSLYLYSLELFKHCRPRRHQANITCLHWNVRYSAPLEDNKPLEPLELSSKNSTPGLSHVNLYFHTNLNVRASDVNNPQDVGKKGMYGLIGENQNYYTKDGEVIYIDPHQMIRERVASLLFIGHADGRIEVEGQGIGPVLNIKTKEKKPLRAISVAYDFSLLLALAGLPEEERVLILPTDLLHDRYAELFEEIRIRHQIHIRLKTVKTLIADMCSKWDDFLLDLDSKFAPFEVVGECKKQPDPSARNLLDSPAQVTQRKISIQPQEFLEFLVFGQISLNLERFLAEMNRNSGIAKFSYTFESTFDYIQQLIVNFQAILMQIIAYLNTIRGVNCDMEGPYVDTISYVNYLYREVILMHTIFGRQLITLSQYQLQMKSLAHLLNRSVIMAKSEDLSKETENLLKTVEEDGTMTVTDLNLLIDFLYESAKSGGFRFEKVSNFLKCKSRNTGKTTSSVDIFNDEYEEDEIDEQNSYGIYLQERQMRNFVNAFSENKTNGLQDTFSSIFTEHLGTSSSTADRAKAKCPEEAECQAWLEQLIYNGTSLDHLDLPAVADGWSVHNLYRRVKRSWKLYINQWVAANDREHAKSGQLNYRCVQVDYSGSPRRDLVISSRILRDDLRPRCLFQAELIGNSTVVVARIPLKPVYDTLDPNHCELLVHKDDELPETFHFTVDSLRVISFRFFGENLLTVLVEDTANGCHYLVQIPFAQEYPLRYVKQPNLLVNWKVTLPAYDYNLVPTIEENKESSSEVAYRKFSYLSFFTTNAPRQLSCCITSNRHRISFYEMDCFDDDFEEPIMDSQKKDGDSNGDSSNSHDDSMNDDASKQNNSMNVDASNQNNSMNVDASNQNNSMNVDASNQNNSMNIDFDNQNTS